MYIIMLYAYIPMIMNQLIIIILLQMKNVLPVTVLSLVLQKCPSCYLVINQFYHTVWSPLMVTNDLNLFEMDSKL